MTTISFRTILTIMAVMHMTVSAAGSVSGTSNISQLRLEKSAKARYEHGHHEVLDADADADANAANTPSSAAIIHEISNDRNERKLSVLSAFFQFVAAHHCLPGPLGDHCRSDSGGSGSGGSSGSSSSSSGGSSSSSGSGGTSVSASIYYDGNGGYYDGSGGGSGGSGGNSANNAEGGGGSGGSGGSGFSTNNFLAIAGAVMAASVAIAAMYMGSRKRNSDKRAHPLHGTLKKRMGLFGRLAERSNCATCRPEDVKSAIVEDGDVSDADYRLA